MQVQFGGTHNASRQGEFMIHLSRSSRSTALATLLAFAPATTLATTIIVSSNSDAVANDGLCTLREAIVAANTNATSGGSPGECVAGQALPAVDTIAFAIAGSGVHTIVASSQMPQITEAVTINGYTQAGATANTLAVGDNAALRIQIDAGSLPASTDLFQFVGGSGSTVRGLVISHPQGAAFSIGGFSVSDNNTIAGNFIGTDPTGTVHQAAGENVIHVSGVSNTIGGTNPADRNVIGAAGTATSGTIDIFGGNNNFIQGNYIGIDATGSAALQPASSAANGIRLGSATTNVTIGGAVPGAGNAILASNVGIRVLFAVNGVVIQGNTLGTDAVGSTGLGGSVGIDTGNGPQNITIGGGAPGAGNLISGVSTGIFLGDGAANVIIQGNKIGTDSTGTRAILNSANGIDIRVPGAGSVIGGTLPGQSNTIAFNCGHGVSIGATQWAMLRNSIHSNGGLGISFGSGTPTPNDSGDGDTGPNNLQNYPVITSAPINAGIAAISGTLNSTPNTTFRIELFAGSSCDNSGFGEGRTFIGTTDKTTDANGDVSFGPLSFAVPAGQAEITSTATDAVGNTSEFSQCFGPHDHVFANGFEFACNGAESN
jgi:CSLREA domain-containing protein